ncbi:transposase [Modestobacter marinus]|uniref:transposase n=1 Tax=Modestobacter marinus TaxID=477641 RepID=UPI003F75D05A
MSSVRSQVTDPGLDVEIADHLDYEAGDPAGNGSGNFRTGHRRSTLHTTAGPVQLTVQRDASAAFRARGGKPRRRRPIA